jgi:hypothetical protein
VLGDALDALFEEWGELREVGVYHDGLGDGAVASAA